MLSVTNCREILGADSSTISDSEMEGADSSTISDSEMEALRDQLYYLAMVTINTFRANSGNPNSSSNFRLSLNQRFAETRAEVEERAAVMEFDGKLSRDEAERAAIAGAVKDWNN